MRELVYVSKRKLSQFQSGTRRGFFSRITGFGVKAPLAAGEVSVTLAQVAQQEIPELQVVIDQIEESDRGVQWAESDELQVGDWITFDAKMNYAVHGQSDATPLIFWEPKNGEELAAFRPWPPVMRRILLLHGSSDGLVGNVQKSDMAGPAQMMSDPQPLFVALKKLVKSEDVLGDQSADMWQYALLNLRSYLDEEYPSFTASWLAGYARVTAILPPTEKRSTGFVLATPLYVERVPPPPDDQ